MRKASSGRSPCESGIVATRVNTRHFDILVSGNESKVLVGSLAVCIREKELDRVSTCQAVVVAAGPRLQ